MVGFVETQLRSSAAPEDARDSALRLADAGRPETEHGPGQHIDIHSHLHQILNTIAPLQVDVLIQGETGTGKDTLARRLYQLSGCRGPMVPVNCAAIPETLAESELFGVMTGAFTGASASRAGYIETANDGLLFLDDGTSAQSKTEVLAKALQLPHAFGDLTLDGQLQSDAILKKLDELERIAQRKGTAIGIASAFDESIAAIRKWADEASQRGVEIVGVSTLARESVAP